MDRFQSENRLADKERLNREGVPDCQIFRQAFVDKSRSSPKTNQQL